MTTTNTRKIHISVTNEGIILTQYRASFKVLFESGEVVRITYTPPDKATSLAAHGVIGILDVGVGYLIVITSREVAATIGSQAIYGITDTTTIPLEHDAALTAIEHLINGQTHTESEDAGDEDDVESDVEISGEVSSVESSLVEDVLLRRPSTIALRSWLPSPVSSPEPGATGSRKRSHQDGLELIPKLLKALNAMLTGGNMFYSHDLDLTNAFSTGPKRPRNKFIFNRHISSAFTNTSLYLPILQGFVKSIPLTITDANQDNSKVNRLVLISRRSTKRPGVRYLRRGIDDEGYCANWVETEQLLVIDEQICSYVQLRGSIPTFFAQSPYKLQPTPKLIRKKEDSLKAFSKHLTSIKRNYGLIQGISLVEMPPSKEGAVGLMYAELAEEQGMDLEWFDFHTICKGMRFDKVTQLYDTPVGKRIYDFGWSDSNGAVQKGVFRVNCIDCLDRTNVVETANARIILEAQMKSLNFEVSDTSFVDRFNGLWADNGDAVSRQYAGTSALKGDFTRTQQRNYKGVLTDAFLSLSRYFHGVVTDFFLQAVIDFIHGYADEQIFVEFEEHLQSQDPAANFDSVRNSAIEIASSTVIASDDEMLLGGWWLLTPSRKGKLRRVDLVDCILLITDQALYVCKYDLESDKVLDFMRIISKGLKSVQIGAFFTQILSTLSKDPSRNPGMVLNFDHSNATSSSEPKVFKLKKKIGASSLEVPDSSDGGSSPSTGGTGTTTPLPEFTSLTGEQFVAFKIPAMQVSEQADILTALMMSCNNSASIEEKDIVTLEEAKGDTGYWASFGYQVKKALWG